jgi:DNA repair exonuclease SbcCD ATPase subunit
MASNAAGEEPVEAIETPASDMAEILRRLDAIRSTLQTAVLGDVMALLAEPESAAETPLQRRARIVQIELTLRRQEVALEEWRARVRGAETEAERQRQLFARLEAEFVQRNAALERAVAEAGQIVEALRTERDAALEQSRAAIDEKVEFERRAGDKARDFGMASELAETRRQLAETLEQDLVRTRRELGEVQQRLAQAQEEQSHALGEAERRIEELRSSRWRQLGIGLGMTKRATFEK